MSKFSEFAQLVRNRFETMSVNELFIVEDPDDEVWTTYLDSFPEGTNPTFKERAEYDCSTCKNFVRNLGRVVGISNGEVLTVWDCEAAYPFNFVCEAMSAKVRELQISGVFRSNESQYGAEVTRSTDENGDVLTWNHFSGHMTNQQRRVEDRSERLASKDVLYRGLTELSKESLDAVVGLIQDSALYRGEEFLSSVAAFRDLLELSDGRDLKLFAWEHCGAPNARFKNTVIGTLVADLSAGVGIEEAVGKFESKVAPTNYKRPKALITPAMVNSAMQTIDSIGLRESLERRHATLEDVSVNNVLFADRSARPVMRDALAESLLKEARPKTRRAGGDGCEISIEDFVTQVLPGCDSIALNLEGRHLPNFVSVTAPKDKSVSRLFQWGNDFAWSYDGNVADSDIKQRVKAAGGNVSAPFRVSLAWFNRDDLDIHVIEPSGNEIYYGNRSGKLDVDMNVNSSDAVRGAVENVCWQRPQEGDYFVSVNNYTKRERVDVGFDLELESNGAISRYNYTKTVSRKVSALRIRIIGGEAVEVEPSSGVSGGARHREHWGISTGQPAKVNLVMLSPNHWDNNATGNKHWFFILEDCINPEPVRGIYNEFLRSELTTHRKVFEILGDKTKCPPAERQLSGVGFSSTKRQDVLAMVTGEINRQYKINF